jgi:hypothetical protein
MKPLLLLGLMMMFVGGSVRAQDLTVTPNAAITGYTVNLTTDPKIIEANQPFTLTLSIFDIDSKTPISEFDEVHT